MTRQIELVEPPLHSRSVQIPIVSVLTLSLLIAVCCNPLTRHTPDGGIGKPVLIDLNQAPPHELALLPGVGPVLAKRIFENRSRLGPFGSAQDVSRVYGVGEKTVQLIAPYATVGLKGKETRSRVAAKSRAGRDDAPSDR